MECYGILVLEANEFLIVNMLAGGFILGFGVSRMDSRDPMASRATDHGNYVQRTGEGLHAVPEQRLPNTRGRSRTNKRGYDGDNMGNIMGMP
jgi:hypothetical protein